MLFLIDFKLFDNECFNKQHNFEIIKEMDFAEEDDVLCLN